MKQTMSTLYQFLVNELSVIIPVFNGERTLEKCLRSVFDQKYLPPKFEVVVIDDGSTDKTVKIAKKFPVCLIKLPKNQGRITAREIGVKKARYQYLLFIDSDCYPSQDWLWEILKENYQPIMGKVINNYQTALGRFFYLMRRFFYKPVLKPTKITERNFLRLPTGTDNFLCRKDFYLKVNIPQKGELFSDDQALIFEINKSRPVLVIPGGTMFHDERYFLKDVLTQWFQRGCRFADFHLTKGGYLNKKIGFWLPMILLLIIGLSTIFEFKRLLFIFLLFILLGFLKIFIRTTEKWKDPLIITFFLPVVSFIFFTGIIKRKLIWTK